MTFWRSFRPTTAVLLVWALWGVGPRASGAQKPTNSTDLHTSAGLTEVGLLDGAPYRIDIPENWNHSLVVYYHGYAQQRVSLRGNLQAPISYHPAERLTGLPLQVFERHYAVAQSAYSQTGWALQQAYPETESLRRYFERRHGRANETFVAGDSMGGALVMVTLELNPRPYMGGLDLCGAVGPTSESFERRFALRAAFDVYFPGLMPALVPVPADYEITAALREKIAEALKANPAGATAMRALAGLHTDHDLVEDMAYFTYVIGEMQRRAGGNPFDNENWIYTGTNPSSSAGDIELNDKVRRYSAQPAARDYLLHHYTPSGRLGRPMLALHTVYDPTVPASQLALYAHQVEFAGFGTNLVQQYIHRDGHCTMSGDERGRAFDELVQWTHGGSRPTPGLLR